MPSPALKQRISQTCPLIMATSEQRRPQCCRAQSVGMSPVAPQPPSPSSRGAMFLAFCPQGQPPLDSLLIKMPGTGLLLSPRPGVLFPHSPLSSSALGSKSLLPKEQQGRRVMFRERKENQSSKESGKVRPIFGGGAGRASPPERSVRAFLQLASVSSVEEPGCCTSVSVLGGVGAMAHASQPSLWAGASLLDLSACHGTGSNLSPGLCHVPSAPVPP